MIHQLKIESAYFSQIETGIKTFEVRKNDRDYHIGDYLALNELTDTPISPLHLYTGRCMIVRVVNILSDERFVKEGYVVMSIKPCKIIPAQMQYGKVYDEGLNKLEYES